MPMSSEQRSPWKTGLKGRVLKVLSAREAVPYQTCPAPTPVSMLALVNTNQTPQVGKSFCLNRSHSPLIPNLAPCSPSWIPRLNCVPPVYALLERHLSPYPPFKAQLTVYPLSETLRGWTGFDHQRGIRIVFTRQEKHKPVFKVGMRPCCLEMLRTMTGCWECLSGSLQCWGGLGTLGHDAICVRRWPSEVQHLPAISNTCFHLTLTIMLWNQYHYYPHFREKEIRTQNLDKG